MGSELELWIEYGLGTFTFLLRFFARWKIVGLRNFAWDDFFAFIAMLMWTADAVVVHIIYQKGSFVGLNEVTANDLTDSQVHNYTIGSKALFAAWLTYVTLIWSLKASLLFFYARLTLQLGLHSAVKILGAICAVFYAASLLVLFLHCTPIQKNWQIKPYAGDECTLTVLNYIFTATANVFADACILTIPIAIIHSVQLPTHRKIMISLLLCSGVFVMTAALLRCILSITDKGNIDNSTIWGIRETFVSVLAISAPVIRPIFSKSRWINSSHGHSPRSNKNKFAFRRSFEEFDQFVGGTGLELRNDEREDTSGNSRANDKTDCHREDVEKGEGHNIDGPAKESLQKSFRSRYGYDWMNIPKPQFPQPILWSRRKTPNLFANPQIRHVTEKYIESKDYDYEDVEEHVDEEEFTPALITWLANENDYQLRFHPSYYKSFRKQEAH